MVFAGFFKGSKMKNNIKQGFSRLEVQGVQAIWNTL